MLDSSDISIAHILNRAWQLFCQAPLTHILSTMLLLLFSILSLGILLGPLSVGYLKLAAKEVRNEATELEDLATGFQYFTSSVLTSIIVVYGGICAATLFLLPGLLIFFISMYALSFVAFENNKAITSLQRSWYMIKQHPRNHLLFALVLLALNILGILSILGIFISIPLSVLLLVQIFNHYKPECKQSSTPTSGID